MTRHHVVAKVVIERPAYSNVGDNICEAVNKAIKAVFVGKAGKDIEGKIIEAHCEYVFHEKPMVYCEAIFETDDGLPQENPPLTDAELEANRGRIDNEVGRYGHRSGDTCNRCLSRRTCKWVFDPYNTNGDCIASK